MDEKTRAAAIRLQNVATRLLRLARSGHSKHGITSAQYSALGVLHERGPMPLVELARAERVSHPTMSRVVRNLERMGAVARAATDDRRSRLVELTDSGRALYEQICGNRVAIAGAIISQLKPETVADMLDVVDRAAVALEENMRRD